MKDCLENSVRHVGKSKWSWGVLRQRKELLNLNSKPWYRDSVELCNQRQVERKSWEKLVSHKVQTGP